MNIEKWSTFTENTMDRKVIMNMFICKHEHPKNPNWERCVNKLYSIKFPTSVETSLGHHIGLAIQVLLDTNLVDSISFCTELLEEFLPEVPLIVISEVNVKIKKIPIGYWGDIDLVQPGRYFDKLVKEGETGLVIIDENTPKIIKKTDKGKYPWGE